MQVSNEIVPVLFVQAHERSSHNNKLDLVNAVAELLELLQTVLGLQVGIISSSNGSHRGRLVSGVRLGRVFKVRVWASWTVNTGEQKNQVETELVYSAKAREPPNSPDVSRHGDVRASMRLAHDSDDGNLF